MKKKRLFWMIAIVVIAVTIALILIGLVFNKSEDEKQNGLSGHYDVSSKGMIAYVNYTNGKPELHLYRLDQPKDSKTLTLEHDKIIMDPTFSNNGKVLAFIEANKDLEAELKSTVHQLDLETMEDMELFTVPTVITEIEFSPKDDSLFYLRAGVFKNYSPITGKRPHDIDVYEYKFAENKHIQHTNLKKYSMESLTIAQDGKSVFLQMPDDAHVKTAEDSFEVQQRIFEIPLDYPEKLQSIVIDPEREIGIFAFTITPNQGEIIYQAISNQDSGGTFQYELYKYNMKTKEDIQLTNLEEYAGNPVISLNSNKIYFMVDKGFGKRNSEYHLYRMNMDGTKVKEVPLLGQED